MDIGLSVFIIHYIFNIFAKLSELGKLINKLVTIWPKRGGGFG